MLVKMVPGPQCILHAATNYIRTQDYEGQSKVIKHHAGKPTRLKSLLVCMCKLQSHQKHEQSHRIYDNLATKINSESDTSHSCPRIPRHSAYNTRRSQSDGMFLEVPHFASVFKSRKHFGLSFAYDAPMIWNDLPDEVRSANSLASFRSKLKSYLFGKAFPP